MKIGYARVSTEDQKLDVQIDALKEAGCEKIYKEKVTGTKRNRSQLVKMLEHVRAGDVAS
jgi:DNA invertase Pin-like site-specific DNA recombinase